MLTYLRYALATFCFAASVGCLALWWRSQLQETGAIGPTYINGTIISLSLIDGGSNIVVGKATLDSWHFSSSPLSPVVVADLNEKLVRRQFAAKRFTDHRHIWVYFPLWYPALIFSLAGVGVLRFRRRFSIRSALIAVSVVAALPGMAVGL